jgi:uncharacterized protein (TIGR02246 family)
MRRHAQLMMLLMLVAPAVAATCKLTPADEQHLRPIPAMYRDAWLTPQAQNNVMRLFADDAVILPAHGTAFTQGKAKVAAWWWPPNARPFQILEFTISLQKLNGCGEVAYGWGTQTLKWKYNDEEKTISQAGTFMMVFRKQADGRWLISSFMWDDQPYVID